MSTTGYDRSDKDDARYEAVTLDDIRRITKKYLSEEKFVISVVQRGSRRRGDEALHATPIVSTK